jgi:hypothetical protein
MDKWRLYFDRSPDPDLWTICERALAIAYIDRPEDFPSHRDRFAQKLYAPEKLCLALDDGSSHKRPADGGERGRRAAVREGEGGRKMAAEGGKEREKALVDGEKGKKKALVEGEKSKKKAMYEEKEDKRIGLSNKIHRSSDVDEYKDEDEDDDADDDAGVGDGHDGNEDSNDVINDVEDDGNDDDDGGDRLRKCKYDEAEALTDEMEEEILLKRDMVKIKESLLDSYKVCNAFRQENLITLWSPFILSLHW